MTAGPSAQLRADVVRRLRAAGCVFAEDEADLLLAEVDNAGLDKAGLDDRVARRAAGEPLEHVLGWALFCGVRVGVAPGVFVPRVRSEHLARLAVRQARSAVARAGRAVVVDLCCGSGALGLVVARQVPGVELHASDVDPVAVACATRNLAVLGADAADGAAGDAPASAPAVAPVVHLGDLDAALPTAVRGRVDVLVANVPYVPSAAVATMPAEARLHEGRTALDGGPDGLDVLRRVARLAPTWLASGGSVLVEVSAGQQPAALAAFLGHGLTAAIEVDDELEAGVVVAVAPG